MKFSQHECVFTLYLQEQTWFIRSSLFYYTLLYHLYVHMFVHLSVRPFQMFVCIIFQFVRSLVHLSVPVCPLPDYLLLVRPLSANLLFVSQDVCLSIFVCQLSVHPLFVSLFVCLLIVCLSIICQSICVSVNSLFIYFCVCPLSVKYFSVFCLLSLLTAHCLSADCLSIVCLSTVCPLSVCRLSVCLFLACPLSVRPLFVCLYVCFPLNVCFFCLFLSLSVLCPCK
jgi:hypothetical protein